MQLAQTNKEYHSVHNLFYSCQYHIIFCSKYRRKIIVDEVEVRLRQLILEKQAEYAFKILDIKIAADHVHLLIEINPRLSVVKVVKRIKDFTARALRVEFPAIKSRLPNLWTRSMFVSTVGVLTLDTIEQYLENQKGV